MQPVGSTVISIRCKESYTPFSQYGKGEERNGLTNQRVSKIKKGIVETIEFYRIRNRVIENQCPKILFDIFSNIIN